MDAQKDVDPDAAQRMINAMEMAFRFMHKNEARTVEIAKQEFPTSIPRSSRPPSNAC